MSWSRTFYDYSTFFSVVQSKFLYGHDKRMNDYLIPILLFQFF